MVTGPFGLKHGLFAFRIAVRIAMSSATASSYLLISLKLCRQTSLDDRFGVICRKWFTIVGSQSQDCVDFWWIVNPGWIHNLVLASGRSLRKSRSQGNWQPASTEAIRLDSNHD